MSIYATFPAQVPPEELDKALESLPYTPDKRPLGVRMEDGSYCIIGQIVKDEDCPQEVFDAALDMMTKLTML